MTFTNIQNNQAEAVERFQRLSGDDQLALLWYVYQEIGSDITPKGGTDTSGFEIAQGLYDRIKGKSQDEQLQIQRDIATRKKTDFSQTYGNLNSSTKLALWYLLAQGIDAGEIVPVPGDYQLSKEGQEFLNAVKKIDFNGQVTFLRSAVLPMGAGSPESSQV